MAGIYVHIPFCRKACHYCNFHFSTSLHRKPELLAALHTEISAYQPPVDFNRATQFDTIYIGGGTPSLLTIPELAALLETIGLHFKINPAVEITLETNPDDINPQKLMDWKAIGINRLSIGIQSFFQEDLVWMNRAHTAKQAVASIEWAANAGFDNLTIDLIYGTPTLSDKNWQGNLATANELGITHISCYALTVEEKTPLHYFIKKQKVPPVDEEKQARHFEMLMDWAANNGWEHYEISNLCRPGHRSKHNSAYWTGDPYLAFGPSAHSFDGQLTRWMAVANNALYIQALLHESAELYETETLSWQERLNEQIMTGLRRMDGLPMSIPNASVCNQSLKPDLWIPFFTTLEKQIAQGWCKLENGHLKLTRQGMLRADAIASDLFLG